MWSVTSRAEIVASTRSTMSSHSAQPSPTATRTRMAADEIEMEDRLGTVVVADEEQDADVLRLGLQHAHHGEHRAAAPSLLDERVDGGRLEPSTAKSAGSIGDLARATRKWSIIACSCARVADMTA